MKRTIAILRALAVLLGLFWLATASLDILGLIPYSNETPPLARRAAHSLPLILAGAVFLLPYRAVRSRPLRAGIGLILILFAGGALYLLIDGGAGYVRGERSWHILPVALLISALVAGNTWAFVRITRQES
jgi:peptidoglycan/LPS O-acetylase OafA/YrhL